MLFDSPRPEDSNAPCPDAVRPLAELLYILLYMSSPGKYFQIVGYWVLQACGRFEAYSIRFPRRADSNEILPDSGGHLPTEVSAFFILLTSIAMRTLRNLYHSIPLDRRIPSTLSRRCPTAGSNAIPTFVLEFPRQVLSNC